MRPSRRSSCAIALLALVLLGCRQTGVPSHGNWSLPETVSGEAPEEVLRKHGLAVPRNDSERLALIAGLVEADDLTLREVLVAQSLAIVSVLDSSWGSTEGRWDLPDPFVQRLLALMTPLLDRRYRVDPMDEELIFLGETINILARMRYEPAMFVLTRPEGIRAYGESMIWIWPQFGSGAVRPLGERARSAEGMHKGRLLRALGDVRDTEAVPSLRVLLDDGDPEVRAGATRALRGMKALHDVGRFRAVLEDPKTNRTERREAIEALADAGDEDDLRFLLDRVRSVIERAGGVANNDADEAGDILRALLRRGESGTVLWIRDLLHRKDLDPRTDRMIRWTLVEALKKLPPPAGRKELMAILDDEGLAPYMRHLAAIELALLDDCCFGKFHERGVELEAPWLVGEGFGGMSGKTVEERFRSALFATGDNYRYAAIIEARRRRAAGETIDIDAVSLRGRFDEAKPDSKRLDAAAELLAHLGTPDDRAFLLGRLQDIVARGLAEKHPHHWAGPIVIRALLAARDAAAIRWTIEFVERPDVESETSLRHAAVLALGAFETKEAIPPLTRVLDDESRPRWLRAAAAQALAMLDHEGHDRFHERWEALGRGR